MAGAALGVWAAELVRAADRAPLVAVIGAVAAFIVGSRREVSPRWLLAGATAACGLRLLLPVADPLLAPRSIPWLPWNDPGLGPALLLGAVAVGGALLARLAPRGARQPRGEHLAAIVVAFAGGAAQLAALGRISGRVGLGTPEDAAVTAAVAAALVLAGGLLLGPMIKRPTETTATWLALGAGLLGLFALAVAGGVTSPSGFAALCERFGADRSLAGTLLVDAVVAATVLVAPALVLGAAAAGLRSLPGLVAAVLGAAIGVWLSRWMLMENPMSIERATESLGSASVVRAGALLTAGGAALAARRSVPGLIAAAGSAALAGLLPLSAIPVERPWDRFPVPAAAIVETRAGQFTLQERRGGARQVWLDQRALTPGVEDALLDALCVAEALAAYARSPEVRDGMLPELARARVAILGPITPDRAAALHVAGVHSADRASSFPWETSDVEQWLQENDSAPIVFPGGQRYAGAAVSGSHMHLDELGDHDLVIAPPVGSELVAGWRPVPWTGRIEVRWAALDRPLMLGDTAFPLVVADGLEGFAVGIQGPRSERSTAPSALSWLGVRPDERGRAAQRIAADRLVHGRTEERPLGVLSLHAGAQRASSPFETELERVELDPEVLAALRDHAIERAASDGDAPDVLTAALLEGAAEVLRAQREVPWTFEYLRPVAAAVREPWPALERALAWAEMEELRPADAARRLEGLVGRPDATSVDRRALAAAYVELDRGAEAAALLEPLARRSPSDRELATDLAEALVVAGDPRGRRLAAELLADDPLNGRLMALARGLRSLDPGAALRAPRQEGR